MRKSSSHARELQTQLFRPTSSRGPRLGRQTELTDAIYPLIDRAIAGDVVTLPGARSRGGRPGEWIHARCDDERTAMLACLSCRQPIANLVQLLFHLEAVPNQTHVLARQCGEHGWEAL